MSNRLRWPAIAEPVTASFHKEEAKAYKAWSKSDLEHLAAEEQPNPSLEQVISCGIRETCYCHVSIDVCRDPARKASTPEQAHSCESEAGRSFLEHHPRSC